MANPTAHNSCFYSASLADFSIVETRQLRPRQFHLVKRRQLLLSWQLQVDERNLAQQELELGGSDPIDHSAAIERDAQVLSVLGVEWRNKDVVKVLDQLAIVQAERRVFRVEVVPCQTELSPYRVVAVAQLESALVRGYTFHLCYSTGGTATVVADLEKGTVTVSRNSDYAQRLTDMPIDRDFLLQRFDYVSCELHDQGVTCACDPVEAWEECVDKLARDPSAYRRYRELATKAHEAAQGAIVRHPLAGSPPPVAAVSAWV